MGAAAVCQTLLVVLVLFGAVRCEALAATVQFYSYRGEVLSGAVTACPTPNASACIGGLAALASYVRYQRVAATTEGRDLLVLAVPTVDRTSVFAQMHPDSWGVNGVAFDYLNFSSYFATTTIIDERRPGMSKLQLANSRFVVGNSYAKPSHTWNGFLYPWAMDTDRGIAATELYDELAANSDSVTNSVNAQIRNLKQRYPSLQITIVFTGAATTHDRVMLLPYIDNPPSIIMYERAATTPADFNDTFINNSWVIVFTPPTSALQLNFSTDGIRLDTTKKPLTRNIDLATVASSIIRDAQWNTDQAFFRQQALLAQANDPVLGVSSDSMPLHRVDTFRLCMGGECAAGNLFCTGLRSQLDADVCMTNSGGYRGAGWPAGNVTVSRLWTLLPFANRVCVGKVMGLTLFELLNYSVTVATFNTTLSPTGNHLMQVDGIRYAVDVNRSSSAGRLLGVQVFNRTSKEWTNLSRLAIYSFAVESFLCESFAPYAALLQRAKYPGEVKSSVTASIMQDVVSSYIRDKQMFSNVLDGRIAWINGSRVDVAGTSNATSAPWAASLLVAAVADSQGSSVEGGGASQQQRAATPALGMAWVQSQSTCDVDTYWSPPVDSCLPCPSGLVQPAKGQSSCVVPPVPPSPLGLYIGVPIGVVAGCFLLFLLIKSEISRRKNVRSVGNAPTTGSVTLVFTDIQASTRLWSAVPAAMSVALDLHHAVIRRCIASHRAYEVKTIGDSFMIACRTADQAVALAVDIQRELMRTTFPAAIQEVYDAKKRDDDDVEIDDNPERLAVPVEPYDFGYHGIRVRIGMHTGTPDVQWDEVAKGYDYYGPPVNIAARVESVTDGGQVCASEPVLAVLSNPNAYKSSLVGRVPLKGVPEPMAVYEVATGITGRVFEKPNVEENADDDAAAAGDNSLDSADHFLDAITHLEPVQKEAVDARTAISQIHLLVDFLNELFRVVKATVKDEMMDKLAQGWHIRHRPGAEPSRSYRALALKTYPAMVRRRTMASSRRTSLAGSGIVGGTGSASYHPPGRQPSPPQASLATAVKPFTPEPSD